MSARLYRHLRVHQIFGANTDVGKTVLTTALCRLSASRQKRVFYLKPISTGSPEDADDGHVKQYSGPFREQVQTRCLYRYSEPVSPHLAARLSNNAVPSDETFMDAVATHIEMCARTIETGVLYLETAGGPHSPVMSRNAQVDVYRPLFLPTILIGDPKLGGISSTISAYECLLLRGYRIDGVVIFRDLYYRNFEYLAQYFGERNVIFASVAPPPPKLGCLEENCKSTENYYSQIVDEQRSGELLFLDDSLDKSHAQRLDDLESMSRRTLDTIWWPFVQHGLVKSSKDVTVIDSASGDFFSVYDPSSAQTSNESSMSLLSPKFDGGSLPCLLGSASWWTQALGHGHASLAMAAAKAAGRYGHVIFPQASHLPALLLAERLVHEGPGAGWASRAYFSDDGATGMEIALKMALRAFAKREGWQKGIGPDLGVLGIKGSYHGDTLGAMDACEEGIFTSEWHNARGYWFEPPTVGIRAGRVAVDLPSSMLLPNGQPVVQFGSVSAVYDIQTRLKTALADRYRDFISRTLSRIQHPDKLKLAALVIEPLVMGAGGMIFVDPLFQRVLVDVVRANAQSESPHLASETIALQGIPIVFDEVFVGLYRIGMQTCASVLGVNPDIAVYAKILTGGLVPMAVTLASDAIFQAFVGGTKAEAMLHGHSYTAHPVGCEVANETLNLLDKLKHSDNWGLARARWRAEAQEEKHTYGVWSFWDPGFVNALSMNPKIEETMALGTVLACRMRDNAGGYGSASAETAFAFLKSTSISNGSSSIPFGMHLRTLGNVAYFMCSLNTNPTTLRALEDWILRGLTFETN